MTDNLHAPPHSIEAERYVLGALLLDPDLRDDIALTRDDFYSNKHQRIYLAIKELDVVDIVALSEALKRSNSLELVGGTGYIADLAIACPSSANGGLHARSLREFSDRRRIMRACQTVLAGIEHESVEELLTSMVVNVDGPGQDNIKTMVEVLESVDKQIQHRAEHRDELLGVSTGLVSLDMATEGSEKGDFIIIGGRPGMGKSAFAGKMAKGGAEAGTPGHVLNLEMMNEHSVMRMVSELSDIPTRRLRNGQIAATQEAYRLAKAELSRLPLTFDDVSFNLTDILRSINKAYNRGAKIFFIDFLQLIGNSAKGKSREREIGEISVMLKQTAKRLRVPIVALAQLNREVDKRENKRPVKSDLRDSGSLEQDADKIIFLYREGYYNKKINDDTAEIIVAKGRHTGEGTIKVGWDGPRTRFFEREVF